MDILNETRSLFEVEGYLTRSAVDVDTQFYFEDIWQLGFVKYYDESGDIFKHWENDQDDFLREYSNQIKDVSHKAWNVYSVFLSSGAAPEIEYLKLLAIEDDFRASRKIIGLNIETREDLIHVFLPLLPIQNKVTLEKEDALSRLKDRLESLDSPLTILMDQLNPKQIVSRLIENE